MTQPDEHDYATIEQDTRAQNLALVACCARQQARAIETCKRAEAALVAALEAADAARAELAAATDLYAAAITLFDLVPPSSGQAPSSGRAP